MRETTLKVAVDAGANEGGVTNTLLEHGFQVYAFEPVPQMVAKLEKRFGGDPRVCINRMGLSDKRETIKGVTVLEAWTIGHVGDGGLQKTPNPEVQETFDMPTITLDEYLGQTEIGILKLDVDGFEPRVLAGARKTVLRDRPVILCEFSCYIQKLGCEPKAFVQMILGFDYSVWSMDGKNRFRSWGEIEPQWPYHTSFDVLLLPNEHPT